MSRLLILALLVALMGGCATPEPGYREPRPMTPERLCRQAEGVWYCDGRERGRCACVSQETAREAIRRALGRIP